MDDALGYLLTAGVAVVGLILTWRVARRILAGQTHRAARIIAAVVALGLGLLGSAYLAFWTLALTTKTFWMA